MSMSFDPKDEADFLKHPLFIKWLSNSNEELDSYWHNWVEKHPEKKEMLVRAKDLAKSLSWKEQHPMPQEDFSRIKDNLLLYHVKQEQYKEIDNSHFRYPNRVIKWWLPMAAALVVMGFFMLSYFQIGQTEPSEDVPVSDWIVRKVPKGMKKVFRLPDGSQVTVNSDSEIRFPSSFGEVRTVKLDGQAFFEVVKNPGKPFIVQSGQLKTTVLGTSFDIGAYPEDEGFHVAVVTGKVKVATDNGVSATVFPDEATFFDLRDLSLTKGTYDYDQLIGWKERILKFREESYKQVFDRLSRWYNVEFELAAGVKFPGKYSGEFKNESLENVLKGMEYSLNFDYEMKNGKVNISNK
ncbi:DUF4974 domain-containing protein [Echinicola soli]|uniref:DUF4974 domain-containing protein n=1 Tax=Echinicola soli TaxID=2591634 RepID=A0A514CMC4_9BACT|nr:FecR family protein [Echinicola soli]QDH80966.1 DUF4974 domain-containing protein [Echinicola soli]